MDTLDRFQALKEKQQAQADKIAAQASASASRPMSGKTFAAAIAIVMKVIKDQGRGGLGEPSADLRDIRQDPNFNGLLLQDLRLANRQADMLVSGALKLGYVSQIEGTPLNGAKLTYAPDAQTSSALIDYPILGQTSAEHANDLADALRRDMLRAVGLPLTGQADPTKLAEAIGLAADQHAQRIGAAVTEAYFAGTQAGLIDASKALVGK